MPNSINYFKYFPVVTYNNKSVVNITRRTKIIQQLYSSPLSFLSYSIKNDERPEDIALYYYNDIGKVWLVFLANNIIDPVSQWPLNDFDFNMMIITKYKKLALSHGYTTDSAIINWTKNTAHASNILYYENADGIQITKDTYDASASLGLITADWAPIRIYDYESDLNDKKREIFLFSDTYANQAESELKELLSV